MPRAKNIDQYPTNFWKLLELMKIEQEQLIVCENQKQAFSLRSQLYMFFAALRREADKFEQKILQGGDFHKVVQMDRQETRSYSDIAGKLVLKVEGDNLKVTLRDNSTAAKLLEKSLNLGKVKLPHELELDKIFQRAMERQKTIDATNAWEEEKRKKETEKESLTIDHGSYEDFEIEPNYFATAKVKETVEPVESPQPAQNLTELEEIDRAIALATGTEQKRLKRFKRLLQRRVDLFERK